MVSKRTSKYCKDFENIENYSEAVADTTQVWDCHHRLETHFSNGEVRPPKARLTKEELIALGMYYNRPSKELILLTSSAHHSLHFKGRHVSFETKRKMSEMSKKRCGENSPMWGKKRSEDFRRKVAESNRKRRVSEDTKRKLSQMKSETNKGRHWYTDGESNVFRHECPEGFMPGRVK